MSDTASDNQFEVATSLAGINAELVALDKRRDKLTQERRTLVAKCTHQNPDGTSALVGNYFGTDCSLCGWNDL